PQRPLRGFTWTTGDQDTAFTNWAQPATGGPCPAQRCAALEATLPDEAGQAGPAVYTTPFHLVSAEFQWLPFGSVAAVPCQAGREASLLCVKQPDAEDEPHRCVDTDECQIAGVCQQMCVNYVGGFECYCSEGHELEADGISCSPAGAMGSRASQDLGDELLDDGEDEEDEDEAWEVFDGGWTEMPGIPWMEATQSPDFGLAYRPSFPEDRESRMPYLDPTWPPPLSAPRVPYHSSVLSVTRPVVVSATRPPLPSAHQPPIVSATRPPLTPAPQPPVVPAIHPALPSDHQFPKISANYPDLPSAHQPPVISATHPGPTPAHRPPIISAKYPELFPAHQSPMFPDTQVVDTQNTTHLPRIPANHAPLVTTSSARQTPVTPDIPVLKAQATHHPITSTVQPSLTTTSRPPVSPAHQASPAGRSRRDDRWLLVALLVPTCVFLVVLLALGIVYCTR
ncbi:hypothetical protein E2I00_007639, partial [Balaenoptera physalus]